MGGGGGQGLSRELVTTLTFPFASTTSLVAAEAFPNLPAFDLPVFVTHAPGDPTRLYVVEQDGRIRDPVALARRPRRTGRSSTSPPA